MPTSTYEVYDLANREVATTGFSSRSEARQSRNTLNQDYYGASLPPRPRYVIVRGVDHPFGRTAPRMPYEKAKPAEKPTEAKEPKEDKKGKKKRTKKTDV